MRALRPGSGGAKLVYSGFMTSSAAFAIIKPIGVSANDSVNSTSNPPRISFSFHTNGADTDGVNFTARDGATSCLKTAAPGTAKIYLGPFRVSFTQPLELDTQKACP